MPIITDSSGKQIEVSQTIYEAMQAQGSEKYGITPTMVTPLTQPTLQPLQPIPQLTPVLLSADIEQQKVLQQIKETGKEDVKIGTSDIPFYSFVEPFLGKYDIAIPFSGAIQSAAQVLPDISAFAETGRTKWLAEHGGQEMPNILTDLLGAENRRSAERIAEDIVSNIEYHPIEAAKTYAEWYLAGKGLSLAAESSIPIISSVARATFTPTGQVLGVGAFGGLGALGYVKAGEAPEGEKPFTPEQARRGREVFLGEAIPSAVAGLVGFGAGTSAVPMPKTEFAFRVKSSESTLGVKPGASQTIVENAFTRAAREYHPDIGSKPNPTKFNEAVDAYNTLKPTNAPPIPKSIKVPVPETILGRAGKSFDIGMESLYTKTGALKSGLETSIKTGIKSGAETIKSGFDTGIKTGSDFISNLRDAISKEIKKQPGATARAEKFTEVKDLTTSRVKDLTEYRPGRDIVKIDIRDLTKFEPPGGRLIERPPGEVDIFKEPPPKPPVKRPPPKDEFKGDIISKGGKVKGGKFRIPGVPIGGIPTLPSLGAGGGAGGVGGRGKYYTGKVVEHKLSEATERLFGFGKIISPIKTSKPIKRQIVKKTQKQTDFVSKNINVRNVKSTQKKQKLQPKPKQQEFDLGLEKQKSTKKNKKPNWL